MRGWCISIVCLFVATIVETRGGFPPTFSKPDGDWSINPQYVRSGVPMVIQCKASANPPATYYWLRDGMRVEQKPDLITFDSQSGNLTIGKGFESSYDGDYQCIAENIHGKAMTPYLSLRKTRAETFPGKINEQVVSAYATDYFSLKCEDVPISIPAWDFRWDVIVMKDGKVEDTSPIVEDERIAIDRHGTLHILSLKREDERIYSCSLTNTILLISVGSTKNYNLQVLPKTSNERAPLLKYNDDVTVTAGTDAHLTCIFSYYSLTSKLEIIWYHRGEDVGRGRTIVVTTHRDPTRPGELEDKEGEYQCEAKLGASTTGNVRGIVNLKIVEPPQFLPNMTIPTTALPVQQNAVFNCKAQSRHAYADPPVWMVNTVPLLGCLPKFFECKESLPDGYSQCIPESQLCNAFPECSDASDEQNCPITCSEGQVACGDSCIAPTEECASVRCDYPGFLCKDESKCVTENSVCNGQADCPDGSDEQYCSNSNEVVKLNRFRFSSDHTQLTIPKVTINDMMCLQCVISNEFGTSFSSGCLTVIEKISILKGPNSTYDIVPGTNLTIEVNAVTDPQFQNQMKYEWFYYEEHGAPNGGNPGKQPQPTLVAHRLPIPNLGSQFELSLNNKHMVMRFPLVAPTDNNAYDIYYKMKDRIYSVVISHQFDRVEKNFTVNGEELLKPKPDPIVEAASTNLWFIALILAILILFIVVALIVCYMYRNRGGTYPLDKKEHQAGHDPEQELKNNGFNDVGRIDDDYDDKPQGEEASLSESVKPYESDDDPTEEYGGDFDVSKFNEDGSFIGLYGDKKSKYSSEAKEATV